MNPGGDHNWITIPFFQLCLYLKFFQGEKLGEKNNKGKMREICRIIAVKIIIIFPKKKNPQKAKTQTLSPDRNIWHSRLAGRQSVYQLLNTCSLQVSVRSRISLTSERDTKMCSTGCLSSKLLRIKLSSTELFFALDLISWEVLKKHVNYPHLC